MSGASGKVASAIHMSPEALSGGMISKIQTGDKIRIDADKGVVELLVPATELEKRKASTIDLTNNQFGMGRELFTSMRRHTGSAEEGATIFSLPGQESEQ